MRAERYRGATSSGAGRVTRGTQRGTCGAGGSIARAIRVAVCVLLLLAAFFTSACGGTKTSPKGEVKVEGPIVIGLTAGLGGDVWLDVQQRAAKAGLQLVFKNYPSDSATLVALGHAEVFAGALREQAALTRAMVRDPGWDMRERFMTLSEPLALYGAYMKRGSAFPDDAVIGMPKDPSQFSRALQLLAQDGLIQLDRSRELTLTSASVTENRHRFRFRKVEEHDLKALRQTDLAVLSAYQAAALGLDPNRDALVMERADTPYSGILVTPEKNMNDPRLNTLQKLFQSADTENYLRQKYQKTLLPAWK